MSEFKSAVITRQGRELLAEAQTGDIRIVFTRGVSGDGKLSPGADLREYTALKQERQSFNITRVRAEAPDAVSVQYVISNKTISQTLTEGYYVREVGIYAKEEGGEEILYAVAAADEPDFMPAFNDLMPTSIAVKMYCEVAEAETATLIAAEGVYALESDLEINTERLEFLEYMVYFNDYVSPIDVGGPLITDDGNALLANWKYKEA